MNPPGTFLGRDETAIADTEWLCGGGQIPRLVGGQNDREGCIKALQDDTSTSPLAIGSARSLIVSANQKPRNPGFRQSDRVADPVADPVAGYKNTT